MPSSKKNDPPDTARRAQPVTLASTAHVPRVWLIGLATLLVVPWLVVAALYMRDGRAGDKPGVPVSPPNHPAGAASAAGPWGRLSVTPIVVSPPLEYVASDWARGQDADAWHFPATSADEFQAFLTWVGLPADVAARLRASAQADPRTRGFVVTPDLDLVRSLSPEVRAKLYTQLARTQLNFDQANSFRFLGGSTDAWLGGSLISPQTRQLVEPLIYHDGDFMHFADAATVRARIKDPEELRRLAKTLLRQSTFLVRLSIGATSEVDGLAEYWGRGGRRLDLRPLLESVVGAGPDRSIDMVHLLPTFARNNLYRYPRISTADMLKPLLANCLWTSLNFFNSHPDNRFLDVDVALSTLRNDYYVVEHGYQLGDVVAFLDDEGDLFHVAVYLADNLVFTKNGTSPMAPWTIMTIDQLKGYYRRRADDARLIFHRRNDL